MTEYVAGQPFKQEFPLNGETLYVEYPGAGSPIEAAAALRDSQKEVFARGVLCFSPYEQDSEPTQSVRIGNDHIIVNWDEDTGYSRRVVVVPKAKIHTEPTRAIFVETNKFPPLVTAAQEDKAGIMIQVGAGIVYRGYAVREVYLDYGEEVGFAPKFVNCPLSLWREKRDGEEVLLVRNHPQLSPIVVHYQQPPPFETFTRLLRRPAPQYREWQENLADSLRQLRFQVLDSENWASTWRW